MSNMELIDNSRKRIEFTNAVMRKYHNKNVTVAITDSGNYVIEIVNLDKEYANEPCVKHESYKDKVRVSHISISHETLMAIIINSIELINK